MKPCRNAQEWSSSICDVNIIVEGRQFGAHWSILREKSTFFDEFYRRKKAKSKSFDKVTCVHLKGVSARLFGLFLRHVYMNDSKSNSDGKSLQLRLNDIDDVLKFSIMFGLRDVQAPSKSNNLEAQLDCLDEAKKMSQLHRNLLQFLYVRTAKYKTKDMAMYIAHKAYRAADMERLSQVSNIVSCKNEKATLRFKLLDVLITLFTTSLHSIADVTEMGTKETKGFGRRSTQDKSKNLPLQDTGTGRHNAPLRAGLCEITPNPHLSSAGKPKRLLNHKENGTKRKIAHSQNAKKTNTNCVENMQQQNDILEKTKCQREGNHNLICRTTQDSCPTAKTGKQRRLCTKPIKVFKRQRSPTKRPIALIREHLERINGRVPRADAQHKRANERNARVESKVARVDNQKARAVKHDIRVGRNNISGEKRARSTFTSKGHVVGEEGHDMRVQGVYNSTIAREHLGVARDPSMIKEKKIDEKLANVNDVRKPKSTNEHEFTENARDPNMLNDENAQGPKTFTRKIRKTWTKSIHNSFPFMQFQDNEIESTYWTTSPERNSENQEMSKCENIWQTKAVSLNKEDGSQLVWQSQSKSSENNETKCNQGSENKEILKHKELWQAKALSLSKGNGVQVASKSQNDKGTYNTSNPAHKDFENKDSLKCKEVWQTNALSLKKENDYQKSYLGRKENFNHLAGKSNVHFPTFENQPQNPNSDQPKAFLNLKTTCASKVLSENPTRERIYIAGGIQKNDYFAHKAILKLNPETGGYKTLGAMHTGRYNHGIAELGNEIYIVGGNSGFFDQLRSVESYSYEHAQWRTKASMLEARDELSLAVVLDCLYAIGGHNGVQDLQSVERFDARENEWSFVSPMKNYRAGACAVAVDDRYIYVVGGFGGETYMTSAEKYDVTSDLWTDIQPISKKRAYSCAVLFGRGIYVVGGFDGESALSSCEMFDIDSGSWEFFPPMNTPRMNATTVTHAGGMFVLGGESDGVFLDTVECYNMTNKAWSFVHHLPQPMAGLRACVYLEDKKYTTKVQTSSGS